MGKTRSTTNTRPRPEVGEQLVACLTNKQLAKLLSVVFSQDEPSRFLDGLRRADADMAETVSRILEPPDEDEREVEKPRKASGQKLVEIWDGLWSRWNDIAFEVGDEDGRYVEQGAHWEEPCFDGYALTRDLDEVAAEMLDLIDDVLDVVDEPDLFFGALHELASNIESYPEWMGAADPCGLEQNTTQCVLRWTWRAAQKTETPAQAMLEGLRKLEDEIEMVELGSEETVAFFTKLPEPACRDIYECLSAGRYEEKLSRVHSPWHRINHFYEERFDSGKYLKTCRAHLSENWRYGKPLIDDAIARGDYDSADSLLAQTFTSYLRHQAEEPWRPEASLVLVKRHYDYPPQEDEIRELLDAWTDVAEKLGDAKRHAALRFQSVTYRSPEDWPAVVSQLRECRARGDRGILSSLFAEWRDEMVSRSIRGGDARRPASDTWIHWLVDALADAPGGAKRFREQLADWLDGLADGRRFDTEWRMLARLTKDLPEADALREQYPAFCEVVLPEDIDEPELTKSRQWALSEMGIEDRLPVVEAIWQTFLHRLVPDPADARGSAYGEQAGWMRALFEIDRDGYDRLLAEWHLAHGRRRNLWRDMRARELPL